jgi:hypothetical protein
MHFRIRGNNVQLVKTVADPSTGKTTSRPIGSANLTTGRISERAAQSLSGDDVTVVERWLSDRRELEAKRRHFAAQALPMTLADVVRWVNEAESDDVKAIAEELQFAMADLRRALTQKLRA